MSGQGSFSQSCSGPFPYALVEAAKGLPNGFLNARTFSDCSVIRTGSGPLEVRAFSQKAATAGLGDHFKVVWQTAGVSRLHLNGTYFDIGANQVYVVPVGEPYTLEVGDGYDALMLIFNPKRFSRWDESARDRLGFPSTMDIPLRAAAASAEVLLQARPNVRGSELVVQSVLDLVFHSALGIRPHEERYLDEGKVFLTKAAECVEGRLGDANLSPIRMAKQLGMSRRTLYDRMAVIGLTPAAFIRDVRLERAHADLTSFAGRRANITEIALNNGFTDSSAFSRAFRTKYGVAPRELLRISGTRLANDRDEK